MICRVGTVSFLLSLPPHPSAILTPTMHTRRRLLSSAKGTPYTGTRYPCICIQRYS